MLTRAEWRTRRPSQRWWASTAPTPAASPPGSLLVLPPQNKMQPWGAVHRFTPLLTRCPGVNFINILWAAFAPVDPKSVKRYWQLDWILTLLGATGVKAVHKYVGEIEPRFQCLRSMQPDGSACFDYEVQLCCPGVNFINVLRTAFTLVGPKSVKRYWQLDWVLTLWGTTGVKAVRRTLMKSSPGILFWALVYFSGPGFNLTKIW